MKASSVEPFLPRTDLCDLLGIEYPILQAGMGRPHGTPTPPELVAAVSEAGGLGCLGGMGLDPAELRSTIRRVRELTSRPFGVDLILPIGLPPGADDRQGVRQKLDSDHGEHVAFVGQLLKSLALKQKRVKREATISDSSIRTQVQVVLEEAPAVFVAGLGDPTDLVPEAHRRGMIVMGLAGSLRNAQRQRKAGVDVIIAQGSEAGGHTGEITTFTLLPQVVGAVHPTPVVAAGGIADGRGLLAALALGASGVWCGTAFLFAAEANIPDEHRRQLQGASSEDLVLSTCFTGKPVRLFYNQTVRAWAENNIKPLDMPYQTVLMDDFTQAAESAGRFDLTSNPAGQVAGLLSDIVPAAQIVEVMVAEASAEFERLTSLFNPPTETEANCVQPKLHR
jgi:nitronate monooxygenase